MNRNEFLLASITDIQSTIRAIDTKVGVLMIFISFPLANIGKVSYHLEVILNKEGGWSLLLILAFMIFWLFSLIVAIRAISAIDNPSAHITDSEKLQGIFYGAGLYRLNFFDSVFNRKGLKTEKDAASHFKSVPDKNACMAEELSFEQMKLIYIREIKLNRLKWSLRATYLWLASGCLVYIVSRFGLC